VSEIDNGDVFMKRSVVAAAMLLLCISFPLPALAARHKVPRYLTKESSVDMSKMNHIFVGWVDLGADDWALWGYGNKTDWTDIIGSLNSSFSPNLVPGRTITSAKDKGDENAAGNDLYIKFSDVRVDYNNYHLILSIHFIDPKTNSEIALIPVRPYYGNAWGLKNYLNAALDEVGTKVQVEVTGETPGKKQK
jgi:hypothetical protein